MNKVFLILIVTAILFGCRAMGVSKPDDGHMTQRMTTIELHEIAGAVSVQLLVTSPEGTSMGSGVWIDKEYVATCWHVVKDSKGPIQVQIAVPTWFDFKNRNLMWGSFYVLEGVLVAKDVDVDVAILKVNNSPFKKTPPVMLKTDKEEIRPKYSIPQYKIELPKPGTITVLSGFPLGRPEILTQFGNVSGTGLILEVDPVEEIRKAIERHATQEEMRQIHERTQKKLRIFVSVVSNPANSGGPVLDESGNLIGLLHGNLRSPAKDESGRQAIYVRPKRDNAGKFVMDANGHQQYETAGMFQNSGISVIIPTMYVVDLFKQVQ